MRERIEKAPKMKAPSMKEPAMKAPKMGNMTSAKPAKFKMGSSAKKLSGFGSGGGSGGGTGGAPQF